VKLGRQPGAFTAFIDSFSGETLLRLQVSANNENLASYRLYDRHGEVAAESDVPIGHPEGLTVCDTAGEQLLLLPGDRETPIQYCLYSREGALLTCSDGVRTQIFGGFHIEGNKTLSGRPPSSAGQSKRDNS
jgi:hypothetical protein